MRRKRIGAIATIAAIVAWFFRGTLENWFFDQVLTATEPLWGHLVAYGPPTLLAGIALYSFWPELSSRLLRSRHAAPASVVTQDEFLPLSEGARLLYAEARERRNWLAIGAERMSGNRDGHITDGTPESILDFCATYIRDKAPIYGARPPSDRREQIDADEAKTGHFESGALVLKTDHHVFTDLAIKRNDLVRLMSFGATPAV